MVKWRMTRSRYEKDQTQKEEVSTGSSFPLEAPAELRKDPWVSEQHLEQLWGQEDKKGSPGSARELAAISDKTDSILQTETMMKAL